MMRCLPKPKFQLITSKDAATSLPLHKAITQSTAHTSIATTAAIKSLSHMAKIYYFDRSAVTTCHLHPILQQFDR